MKLKIVLVCLCLGFASAGQAFQKIVRSSGKTPRLDCMAHFQAGRTTNGQYWVDPDGPGPRPMRELFCNMDFIREIINGGWTLVMSYPGNMKMDGTRASIPRDGILIPNSMYLPTNGRAKSPNAQRLMFACQLDGNRTYWMTTNNSDPRIMDNATTNGTFALNYDGAWGPGVTPIPQGQVKAGAIYENCWGWGGCDQASHLGFTTYRAPFGWGDWSEFGQYAGADASCGFSTANDDRDWLWMFVKNPPPTPTPITTPGPSPTP